MSTQESQELGKLININKDACEFYHCAQEKAEDPELVRTFGALESLHRHVMDNLQKEIAFTGDDAKAEETVVGQASKLWTNLMTHISNDVDETLVKHLEEAEDRCLHSVQDAMEKESIRPSTKAMLRDELSSLQKSHDYMKALKDCMKKAA